MDVQGETLLVYGELRHQKYERHVALERPVSVPVTALPGVTLELAALFAL